MVVSYSKSHGFAAQMNSSLFAVARQLLLLTLLLSCLFLPGCSTETDTEVVQPVTPLSLELFIQRSSISRSEFEQYKVVGERLFYECGIVRRGRFVPDTQDLISFPGGMKERFEQCLSRVVASLDQGAPLEEAGKASSMADPGIFKLQIELQDDRRVVRTALDSIVDPTTRVEKELQSLATLLRGAAGGEVCGNKDFYGLKSDL